MANRDVTNWRDASLNRPLWAPLSSFRRELDRLFDDFLPADMLVGNRALQPDIEVKETNDSFTVTAELPGIDQKDLQVSLDDNVLTIRGEKRQERHEQERHYTERTYGRFERRIALEREIQADKIEARFKNGVLTVTLPKNPSAQARQRNIEIKT
jgi:HSP20 family protein